MNSIVAEWNVPAVTTYIPGVALSSTTIAENGISGGTEQEAANIPGVGIFSAYYAWYEINGASYAFNIPVGPGDAIWAEASYVTSNLTARYPQDYAFLDYTTSQLTYVPLGAPPVEGSGYFLQWSEERTLGFPLAQFAPFSIWGMAQDFNQNAFALDGSGSDFYAPGAVGGFIPYVQQMTSTGMQAGNLMCTSALASSNVVSLQFVSPF